MDTSAQQQREKDFKSADPGVRIPAIRDSIRAKLATLPKVDHNGRPIDPPADEIGGDVG